MPLSDGYFGTNANGSPSDEYCTYCFKNGAFTSDQTMEQMIEHNLEYLDEFNRDSAQQFTISEARDQMRQFFPSLKRWRAQGATSEK